MAWIRQQKWIAIFLLFYAFLTLINFQVDIGEYGYTDDFYFAKATRETTLPQWVTQRYESWSGRTSADAITYFLFRSDAGLTAWRLLNPLFFLLLFYAIARLAVGPGSRGTLILYVTMAFSVIGLITSVVLIETSYWMTGSINYLWPTALGLFSLIPLWDHVVYGQETRLTLFHILAGAIAANGAEQLALVIPCLALMLMVLWFIKNRQVKPQFIVYLAALVIAAVVMLLAPGSAARSAASEKIFFPGFNEFSLLTKVLLGIQYTFGSLLAFNKVLLVALWVITLVSLWNHSKAEKLFPAVAFSLACGVVVLLMSFDTTFHDTVSPWLFNFESLVDYNAASGSVSFHKNLASFQTMLSIAFWGFIFFAAFPLSLYLVLKKNTAEVIPYLSLYFGGAASLFVMAFTPTIYASGYRPRFVWLILFAVVLVAVIKRAFPGIPFTNRTAYAAFMAVPLILFAPYLLIFRDYSLASRVSQADFIENGKAAPEERASCKIEHLEQTDYLIKVSGWAYVKGQDPRQEEKYVLFRSAGPSQVFTAQAFTRYDVTPLVGDGKNYDRAGITSNVNMNDLAQGRYQVGLGVYDKTTGMRYACFPNEFVTVGSQ